MEKGHRWQILIRTSSSEMVTSTDIHICSPRCIFKKHGRHMQLRSPIPRYQSITLPRRLQQLSPRSLLGAPVSSSLSLLLGLALDGLRGSWLGWLLPQESRWSLVQLELVGWGVVVQSWALEEMRAFLPLHLLYLPYLLLFRLWNWVSRGNSFLAGQGAFLCPSRSPRPPCPLHRSSRPLRRRHHP